MQAINLDDRRRTREKGSPSHCCRHGDWIERLRFQRRPHVPLRQTHLRSHTAEYSIPFDMDFLKDWPACHRRDACTHGRLTNDGRWSMDSYLLAGSALAQNGGYRSFRDMSFDRFVVQYEPLSGSVAESSPAD